VEGSAESFLRDHEWLGLNWDEGPVWQSKRTDRYEGAIAALGDRVFHCTCSRRDIRRRAAARSKPVVSPARGSGAPPSGDRESSGAPHGEMLRYPGTCRDKPAGHEGDGPFAVRFRSAQTRGFEDLLAGTYEGAGDDFVLRRKDGLHAYQLAVVVDDHEMGVTEVVRGDDLLPSTPLQIELYEALGWAVPSFLHVPLVRGADGDRLAKRHHAPPVSALRDAGWSPQRVLAVLATGLVPDVGKEVSLAELRERFSVDAVSRDPVTLDIDALLGDAP
jgi:glutamyl-tRNA synthetase